MKIADMKCYTKRELAAHTLMYAVGIFLLPIGVVLTINSHFGAGGLDALNFAFGKFIHIPTAVSIYILGAIYMCLAAILRRKPPELFVMVTSVLQGGFTGIWEQILVGVQGSTPVSSFGLFVLGNVIVAMTAGPYFLSLFPPNPVDHLTIAVSGKGVRIGVAKIIMECIGASLAFLLHGEVNIGTLLTVLFLGPMIDFFEVQTKKILRRKQVRWGLEEQGGTK